MQFLHNKKVASAIIERVPCSMARPNPDGTLGTHYAAVLLGHNNSVLHVSSQCEHKHGEGIQGLHELGNGNTCFAVTEEFRKILRALKENKPVNDMLRNSTLPTFLKAAAVYTAEHATMVKNTRWRMPEMPRRQEDVLESAANLVATKALSMPSVVYRGNHEIDQYPVAYTLPQKLFHVSKAYVGASELAEFGVTKETGDYYSILYPYKPGGAASPDYAWALAVRVDGDWKVNEDRVKNWAQRAHSLGSYRSGPRSSKFTPCEFCGESYERMSRHTEGVKHVSRVLDIVKLVCKATSTTGLKMLNSPRHRNMFLKPR